LTATRKKKAEMKLPIMKQSIRLYCLPFAGGNTLSYRKLSSYLASHVVLTPLELPGHGKRIREPLLISIDAMIADLLQQILPDIGEPYAIYGHSMGALLGYILTCTMRRQQLPLPLHLFVSGHQSPAAANHTPSIHTLPDTDFLQKLQEYGGIPEAVAKEQELLEFFLPIFRADFQAIEEYRPTNTLKLSVPMTVLFGTNEGFSRNDVLHWQYLTTASFVFHEFPGNHFFIYEHLEAIGNLISGTLLTNQNTGQRA
jgi:surfactin synthase thioesterase subunit